MPATQISFAAFAATLLASAQSEAIESTPPASPELVLIQDGGLVAQAAAGGGECPRFAGLFVPSNCIPSDRFRADYCSSSVDAFPEMLSGCGLDAPVFLPSGSHESLGLLGGPRAYVRADGYGCIRPGN